MSDAPGTIGGAVFTIDADYSALPASIDAAGKQAQQISRKWQTQLRSETGQFVSDARAKIMLETELNRRGPASFSGGGGTHDSRGLPYLTSQITSIVPATQKASNSVLGLTSQFRGLASAIYLVGGAQAAYTTEIVRSAGQAVRAIGSFRGLAQTLEYIGGLAMEHPFLAIAAAAVAAASAIGEFYTASAERAAYAIEKAKEYEEVIDRSRSKIGSEALKSAFLRGNISQQDFVSQSEFPELHEREGAMMAQKLIAARSRSFMAQAEDEANVLAISGGVGGTDRHGAEQDAARFHSMINAASDRAAEMRTEALSAERERRKQVDAIAEREFEIVGAKKRQLETLEQERQILVGRKVQSDFIIDPNIRRATKMNEFLESVNIVRQMAIDKVGGGGSLGGINASSIRFGGGAFSDTIGPVQEQKKTNRILTSIWNLITQAQFQALTGLPVTSGQGGFAG